MRFVTLAIVALSALFLSVKASEVREGGEGGEECEAVTGIFDKVDGPITIDTISSVSATGHRVLVYGMIARPPVEVIKEVLSLGIADVNAFDCYDRCSLSYALDKEDYDAADALIDAGADVNAHSFSPIIVIMAQSEVMTEAQKLRAIDYLLAHGADPKAIGKSTFSALAGVAKQGNVNLVQKFLDLGLDINYQDEYGYTPLMDAAGSNFSNTETVALLLAKGADMTIENFRGWNAVFVAILVNYNSFKTTGIAEYLIENGGRALLDKVNKAGKTMRELYLDYNRSTLYLDYLEKFDEFIAKHK